MTIFKIPVVQFKRSEDPLYRRTKKKYTCYVHVDNIPENLPMNTNPREQRLASPVAQKIEESLVSDDGNFHLKNRGLVLSAARVMFDNKTNLMTLALDDLYEHGDIDGGHTYKIALKHKNEGLNQFIPFEIMVGVEDIIEDLAEARNTSSQVDEKSMAELGQKFGPIKDAIGGMPFYDRIAFKQNQQLLNDDMKKVKMIDAREIVAVLSMFHKNVYGAETHPTQAYSSKAKILEDYLKDPNEFEKLSNIAIDIFDLYDNIERDFPDAYNKTNGRYGAKKYSGYRTNDKTGEVKFVSKAKFSLEPMIYKVPDGLMYPLIASFRALVAYDKVSKKYFWKKDPISVYQDIRENIALKIMKFTDTIGNNPNTTGKDATAWDILYMTVERSVR